MDILISGASVAGPALAHWLSRTGHRVTVVERAPALRDGGYAVDFRGAAHLTVLERMGILAEIRQHATNMGAMRYVDATGRTVATMPADVFSGDVEILRGDLSRILYDHTKDHVEYVFDDTVTAVAQDDAGVHVTFAGSAPRTFDLVIGADGVHSTVRALVFGDESRFSQDLGLHSAVFTTANHLGLDHTGLLHSTPGRTAGVYSARDNTEAKAVFFFASSLLPEGPEPPPDVDDQKKLLAEVYAGSGWEVPRLLREMWPAPDFYFDGSRQVRLDRWSTGRVVLLGDAAWAAGPGGNGTGSAIVGAYILAGELHAAGGDHRAAFSRYEQRLRDYVAGNQKQAGGGAGFLAPGTRRAIWLRNQMFRTLPYMPWKGVVAKMAARTASAITLPNYPILDR
jgi:2-polyprenyl-6-methoxyphenol hydroxylase-like FAD-dependent oxidoreductase